MLRPHDRPRLALRVTHLRSQDRALLLRVAHRAMLERGLAPDFPPDAIAQADAMHAVAPERELDDLRDLPWCSIDNDDSRDLDQLTLASARDGGGATIRIAVADVAAAVGIDSPIDRHARANTTSVYTPPQNFPMLPVKLSTDLTSLGPGVDRVAFVIEVNVDRDGGTDGSNVRRALVRNHAKLAYSQVGPWLEGVTAPPAEVAAVPGLAENLQLQDEAARDLKARRHEHGALELETIEVRAEFLANEVSALQAERRNRAKELIEDFMIAGNGVIARFLEERRLPVVRRLVRTPERWPRIVELAAAEGVRLPAEPDVKALHDFLLVRRKADPQRFPDLSLAVVKLLGRGEYVASFPDQPVVGHFGLAVSEYTHSTAPNRRFPDLVTQRLLHAALAGRPLPYPRGTLVQIASECTEKEDAAQKIERQLRKSAAACWLAHRIGEQFDGIVTGAGPSGTWARILNPPVEGRIERGGHDLDVGDRVRLELLSTDPERGFIDFARADGRPAPRRT